MLFQSTSLPEVLEGRDSSELCDNPKVGTSDEARLSLEAYRSHRSRHPLWGQDETIVPESLGVYGFVLNESISF